jgi:hypothetical protein
MSSVFLTAENIPIFIQSFAIAILAFWAVYIYYKQQKFKRLQNLNSILIRFGESAEFIELFDLFESENVEKLSEFSSKIKMKFLVLLEEVALYSKYSEVDKKYAIHVFQWHFYYVYNDPKLSTSFWFNIGSKSESEKPYWKYQKEFAANCNPEF